MHGHRSTNSTANKINGSGGNKGSKAAINKGMAMKFAMSKAVRNFKSLRPFLSSVTGTCKKVTNNIKAKAGFIAH